MKLALAPMEGVMDFVFRDLITAIGGLDQTTTEFVRVTQRLLPDRVFLRYAPELKMQSRTRSGTPVFLQLLGGQPDPMAENAARVASLGAAGIDLNFGCPAKTVNRHDGGASLLKNPHRLFDVASAVRKAVPSHIPVSGKMRLGFDSPEKCFENAQALDEAGVSWITVHARTKTDGYKPPAHWHWIPRIQEKVKVEVIANGDIWNAEDLERCKQETGAKSFMIGRGALRNARIFKDLRGEISPVPSWNHQRDLLVPFFEAQELYLNGRYAQARTKMWLKLLSPRHPEAHEVLQEIKAEQDPLLFRSRLENLTASSLRN